MADAGPVVEIRPVDDFKGLAAIWRDLEQRADGSFFQSWAWTGCLADERFPEPWLLSAHRGDRVVALALFNRHAGRFPWQSRLLLGETGKADRNSIFIEHNGILVDRDEPSGIAGRCLEALEAQRVGGLRRAVWIMNGVPEPVVAALPPSRKARITTRRPAPYLDFAHFVASSEILDNLSANSRQQIRGSMRAWQAMGPLNLDIAATVDQSDAFLDGLKDFHQRYWTGRGKPGAFAEPFFERFHRALIRRAGDGQSVDLIRVHAGERTVGYLYNFVHRGWVAAYQSGFDFAADADRLRPGLVTHALAIEHYRRAGMRLYDFLGGEARYKRSFANAERALLWLEARRRWFA